MRTVEHVKYEFDVQGIHEGDKGVEIYILQAKRFYKAIRIAGIKIPIKSKYDIIRGVKVWKYKTTNSNKYYTMYQADNGTYLIGPEVKNKHLLKFLKTNKL